MKRIALLLVIIMTFGMLAAGCGTSGTKELVVQVGSEPNTIDPALNSAVDGATMLIHAFEGLMNLDKDGVPVEAQAESYEVSDDGLTYTFTLRDGLKWSDGEPVTAEDYVYSWKRAVDPETAADYAYMFEVIEGYDSEEGNHDLNVQAPDDKTVVVSLKLLPYFLGSAHSPPSSLFART